MLELGGRPARPTSMKVFLTVLCVLTIAACARPAQAPEGGSSGVRGTVLANPACGGPVILDSPCPDKPVAAEIAVAEIGSQDVVATVRSTSEGKFSVDLAPGDYTLMPSAPGGAPFPIGRPTDVTVRAGGFTEVTLTMDSGLR